MKRAELSRAGFWSVIALLGLALSCAAPQASHGQVNDSIAVVKRMGDAFALVAAKASPGVVGIRATRKTARPAPETPSGQPSNPSDEDWFDFFHRQVPPEDTPERERTQRSLGSGFIISEDGYIITNNHMVANAEKVTIELVDGRTMEARVVGTDVESDVAVVKIQAEGLAPMTFGDSESLRIGEWVLAIGNPLGLSHTVTVGIVSAKGRSGFNVATYENFIQTDAAINMGNSGGPLINLDGQAVGINTFILGPGAGNVGIGFAIPINIVKDVADQLIRTGTVERGYLGMIPQDLTPELAEAFRLPESRGAVLAQVEPNSPAARAGLERGDVVLGFGGVKVDSASSFRDLVARHKPGEQVELVILHSGERKTVAAVLGKRPSLDELRGRQRDRKPPPQDESERGLGLTVWDLTPDLAERFGLSDQTGVIIMKVTAGSEAAEKGLREGHVIWEVNRREVHNVQQFKEMVSQAVSGGRRILLLVTDGRASRYVVLALQNANIKKQN